MDELVTGLQLLGGAIGGGKVVEKMLGPTAEYIGSNLKAWTEKGVENVSNILKNASEKIGEKINEEGTVSPKVLKGILEDGYWSDGTLQVEYFGGVLASSRTGISRDDRGAYFNSILSGLSSYQLRSHYIFYQSLKRIFDGKDLNIAESKIRNTMQVFIPYSSYETAMDFSGNNEDGEKSSLVSHAVIGLYRMGLVEFCSYGPVVHMKTFYADAMEGGIVFTPSALGVELLMWAYGHGQKPINHFFNLELDFLDNQTIEVGKSYAIYEMK